MVVKEVRFSNEVEVHFLPECDQRDAWLARHGPWLCAPKHDELWDGTLKQFRPHELTKQELRRLKIDNRVKRVLPSSVFYVYRRYRHRKNKSNGKLSVRDKRCESRDEYEEDEESKRDSETVPREFIEELNEFLESPRYQNDNPGLASALKSSKNGVNASKDDGQKAKKRFSLPRLRRVSSDRRNSPFFDLVDLPFLRRGSEDSEESNSEDDMSDALPWLERIQKLDGLSNSKVHRSNAVEDVWDQLTDNWGKLQLLGQSLIWDGQSILREIWPGNPLDPVVEAA